MGRKPSCCGVLALATAATSALLGLVGQQYTPLLLQRNSTRSCLPSGFSASGPAPTEPLPGSLLDEFNRDGAVLIRGGLSAEWVARLHDTVEDSFAHPTFWDKLYTTGLAAFFCAQKTVMLPMTSRCGQNMARFSPLASYAAQLLDSETIRVAEPSEGMGSFGATNGNCGHTAYHRDDSYFPIRAEEIEEAEANGIAVVRFWIPLEEMPRDRHKMEFVAGSHLTRDTDNLSSTQFATHDAQDHASLPLISWHAKPGDVIAFAGESVHNAATTNCTSCLRLILGFAGDRARFDATVPSPLMPLAGGQMHGARLHGPPFPLVLNASDPTGASNYIESDWEPLAPSVMEVLAACKDSLMQGMKGFEGTWFTGCTKPWAILWGLVTVPEICGAEPQSAEASFWDTVYRVWSRAPLLNGEWHHSMS